MPAQVDRSQDKSEPNQEDERLLSTAYLSAVAAAAVGPRAIARSLARTFDNVDGDGDDGGNSGRGEIIHGGS